MFWFLLDMALFNWLLSCLIRLTHWLRCLCTSNWLSSEKATFFHCFTVQARCCLDQINLFFFMTLVNSCFLTGRRAFLPVFNSLLRIVDDDTWTPAPTRWMLSSWLVFFGSLVLFLKIILSSEAVVPFFLSHLPIHFGVTSPRVFCIRIIRDTLDFPIWQVLIFVGHSLKCFQKNQNSPSVY